MRLSWQAECNCHMIGRHLSVCQLITAVNHQLKPSAVYGGANVSRIMTQTGCHLSIQVEWRGQESTDSVSHLCDFTDVCSQFYTTSMTWHAYRTSGHFIAVFFFCSGTSIVSAATIRWTQNIHIHRNSVNAKGFHTFVFQIFVIVIIPLFWDASPPPIFSRFQPVKNQNAQLFRDY